MALDAIQPHSPSLGQLEQIGLQFQVVSEVAPKIDNVLAPDESLDLNRVQQEDWSRSHFQVETQDGQTLEIDLKTLNQTNLLNSFQQVLKHFNQEAAAQLQSQVQEIMNEFELVSKMPIQKLIIQGQASQVTINPDMLTSENLLKALKDSSQQVSPESMQEMQIELEDMVDGIKEELKIQTLELPKYWAQIQAYIQQPQFKLATFFEAILGFNPLNEQQTVQHLLGTLAEFPPHISITKPDWYQLDQSTRALIKEANALEAALELAPTPDSPDVLTLFRSFMKIIRELDEAVNALLAGQKERLARDRDSLKHFAEVLHANSNFHETQLDQLREDAKARFQLILQKILEEQVAKLRVLSLLARDAALGWQGEHHHLADEMIQSLENGIETLQLA